MSGDSNQADSSPADANGQRWSRRRLLGTTGAAVTSVGLAGCSGGGGATGSGTTGGGSTDGSSSTDGSESGSGSLADDTLSLNQASVPADTQYNPWNGKNFGNPALMLYDRFMYYNLQTKEYGPFAIGDWEFTGDAISLTIRDGYTWHDGEAVTAEDLVTQLKLDMYTGGTMGDSVESIADDVTQVDDRTAEIDLKRTYNEQIILGRLREKRLYGYRNVYGQYVDDIESASNEEDRNSIISDLQSFSYSASQQAEAPNDPIGNGVFRWEEADTRRTLAVKYEDHPDADAINYPRAEWLYLPSNQKRWSAIINGEVDGNKALFMPKNQLDQLPDSVQVVRIPVGRGVGFALNWNDEHLANRNVRKALMHLINREQVATNAGGGTETKIPVEYPSGLSGIFSGRATDHWLDGITDKFETYGRGSSQTEQATTLLEEAGYRQEGDTWVNSETGNELSLTVKGPGGWPDWMSAARTAASHLQSFGITTEVIGKDTSTYWGSDYTNGNFQIGLNSIQAFGFTYPFFDYDWIYRSYDSEELWNVPSTFENVETLGGETTTMEPDGMVSDLASTTSGSDAEMEHVQQLAHLTNQTLPGLPLVVKLRMTFLTTDDWNVPPQDSEKVQVLRPPYMLPQRGEWTAKQG